MTSSEFAARYRLLKNVASRGARSFLAQQVELGRMVMVHYLDAESADQQTEILARLKNLRPAGRDKLLEIADVDGTPVAVTLFISSFVDFATWLDQVAAPPAPAPDTPVPGEFTRAFNKVETAIPAPVVMPRPAPSAEPAPVLPVTREAPTPKTPGEFTRVFGKIEAAKGGAPEGVPEVADQPTLIIEAVKPPRPAPAAPVTPPAPPAPDASSGFTAIFGKVAEPTSPSAAEFSLSSPSPLGSSPSSGERVMPPVPHVADYREPLRPTPSIPDGPQQPGEFTQLFQRLSPTGGTPAPALTPPAILSVPSLAPDVVKPRDAMPLADLAPPLPTLPPPASLTPPPVAPPSLGQVTSAPAAPGGISLGLPPLPVPSLGNFSAPTSPSGPRIPGVPAMPNAPTPAPTSAPPSPWSAAAVSPNVGSIFNGAGAVESEFTRILGRVPLPPPPPVSVQPPAPASDAATQKASKSMMPLIVALNVVLLLTIAIVAYFVLRK